MSARSEMRERADLLSELRQIVQAMKNVAFAELQRVARALPALDEARESVLRALDSVRQDPAPAQPRPALAMGTLWLVIGADRGFCGAFNARLATAIEKLRRDNPQARVLIASRRLAELLDGTTPEIVSLAGCSSIEDAYPALENWLAAIDRAAPDAREVRLLHVGDEGIASRRLLPAPEAPRDVHGARQTRTETGMPLHYLPLPDLRWALVRHAVRLLVQTGLYRSLEQENRARLVQMQWAQDHLDELGRKLRRRYSLLRQAEITNELELLMTSIG